MSKQVQTKLVVNTRKRNRATTFFRPNPPQTRWLGPPGRVAFPLGLPTAEDCSETSRGAGHYPPDRDPPET